jgi:hypothetical protein
VVGVQWQTITRVSPLVFRLIHEKFARVGCAILKNVNGRLLNSIFGAAFIATAILTVRCSSDRTIGPGPAPTPSTGSAIETDDFARSSLGPNWSVYDGFPGIVNDRDLGVLSPGATNLGIVAWKGTTFSADQFSEAIVSSDVVPEARLQVFVRRRVSDKQRYAFFWNPLTGQWQLKRDGGLGAPVLAVADGDRVAPGDRLRIEVQGTKLRGYRNGVLIITAEDSVLDGAGQPGLTMGINDIPRYPSPFFASWSGGSLSTSQ